MGRIFAPVRVANALDRTRELTCDALVDTGAAPLVLPSAWKDRLGLAPVRTLQVETADGRVLDAQAFGPVWIQLEGFDPIFNEVVFIDMASREGSCEPLLGYIVLEQSRAAVDPVGHRLVPVKYVDLK
ncbi:MAG: aspartyl protease family protein [Planctomycetes bacterium]|nr:aspartyl protease family protein [Planctomycetota bacterium]